MPSDLEDGIHPCEHDVTAVDDTVLIEVATQGERIVRAREDIDICQRHGAIVVEIEIAAIPIAVASPSNWLGFTSAVQLSW